MFFNLFGMWEEEQPPPHLQRYDRHFLASQANSVAGAKAQALLQPTMMVVEPMECLNICYYGLNYAMKLRIAEYQTMGSRQRVPTVTRPSITNGRAMWALIAGCHVSRSQHRKCKPSFLAMPNAGCSSLGKGLSLPCSWLV